MNKNLVIILSVIILLGGGVIFWQLSGGEESDSSSSNPTPVSESSSSIYPVDEEAEDDEIPALSEDGDEQILTAEVVAEYNTAESCWTIIDGGVYDITEYVPQHPGGVANIVQICGTDGTSLFEGVGAHQAGGAASVLESYFIGPLEV